MPFYKITAYVREVESTVVEAVSPEEAVELASEDFQEMDRETIGAFRWELLKEGE